MLGVVVINHRRPPAATRPTPNRWWQQTSITDTVRLSEQTLGTRMRVAVCAACVRPDIMLPKTYSKKSRRSVGPVRVCLGLTLLPNISGLLGRRGGIQPGGGVGG